MRLQPRFDRPDATALLRLGYNTERAERAHQDNDGPTEPRSPGRLLPGPVPKIYNLRPMPKSGTHNQTTSRHAVKDYFLNLFRYNEWANRRLVVALSDVADAEPQALVLFSHLVMVERLWLARVHRTGDTFQLWTPLPISELVRQMQESARLWSAFLKGLAEQEFNEIVRYVNSKGVSFENTISDIAAQTVNHSTHHRGQVVALIRRQGLTPPVLDYIVYARKEE